MLLLLPWMRQSDGAEAFEEQMRTRASSRRGCGALVFAKKARRRAHSSRQWAVASVPRAFCGIRSWRRSPSGLCRGDRAPGRGGRRRRVPELVADHEGQYPARRGSNAWLM